VILHAGLVALHTPRGWRGALVEGPSGVGKSDLALRALALGFQLVADDRTLVWRSGDALFGRAPDVLHGLIEVRSLDVVRQSARSLVRIELVAACAAAGEALERLPEPASKTYCGLSLPVLALAPLEPSAPVKLRHALEHLGGGAERAYQAGRAARRTTESGGDCP
jgi:serine kinase of HPr protein (carbohydrate metabolism regulator)